MTRSHLCLTVLTMWKLLVMVGISEPLVNFRSHGHENGRIYITSI